jgi:peptidoglycan hydrolase-like protein with peptidoglycan-binding domain
MSKPLPLQSQAFRSIKRLQACLVDDAAHVAPGAKGDHVARIQQALTVLGHVPRSAWSFFETEALGGFYGPTTAGVVLHYKRKHKIVNYAYQTQADDIVGKMTIRALDDEMVAYERTHSY